MKVVDKKVCPEEIEFFLRLLGLWEGVIALPPPPRPPFDIDTMEPLEDGSAHARAAPREGITQDAWPGVEPGWEPPERRLDEERLLVLDGDLVPADELPLFAAN